MDGVTINKEEIIENALKRIKEQRKGVPIFCVACGARQRTLHKWHNSYLCEDCFKIMKNVGEEKFISALKGEYDGK